MPSLSPSREARFFGWPLGKRLTGLVEDTKGWGSGEICNERISPNSHINPTRISNTISSRRLKVTFLSA